VAQAVGAPRPVASRWMLVPATPLVASRAVLPADENLVVAPAGAAHTIHPQRGLIMRGRRR
jgi:hypothetical protein